MYSYIKGILKSKSSEKAIIENSGIGYELNIGMMTYGNLPSPPEEVMLYTYHYVREDREELYGFSSLGEKELFEVLIKVSGIGPSKAVNILSQVSPPQFLEAIRKEDILKISSIKGIGRKTAEKIMIDLKDKISGIKIIEDGSIKLKTVIEDALSGLMGLGFKENIAREMIYAVKNE